MLPVELDVREPVQQSFCPKQVEGSPGRAKVVLIGFAATEQFRQIRDAEAEIFRQEFKSSSFCPREAKRAGLSRRRCRPILKRHCHQIQ